MAVWKEAWRRSQEGVMGTSVGEEEEYSLAIFP